MNALIKKMYRLSWSQIRNNSFEYYAILFFKEFNIISLLEVHQISVSK